MTEQFRTGLRRSVGLFDEAPALRERVAMQARIIEHQADRIALLERALTPPGRRGLARLRRSAWWLRAWRSLFGRAA